VSSEIAKSRVVVPPHIRADGTRVSGYTYNRKGRKSLTRTRAHSKRVKVMPIEQALRLEGDDLKLPPREKGEPDFAYQARVLKSLPEEDKHEIIAMIRERTDVCTPIHNAAMNWRAQHGIAEPKVDWDNVTCDLTKAKRITQAIEKKKRDPNNPEYKAAYADFKRQTDEMWDLVTRPVSTGGLGIAVEMWDERTEGRDDPYETAEAQALDLINNSHIYVNRGEFFIGNDPLSPTGTKHPFMTGPDYFRFRAVHDIFGHAGVGGGFDRHGEYEAWMHHSSMYQGVGQKAMSTEYHGVNSWLWERGGPMPEEHWGILLPDELIRTPFDEHGNVVRKSRDRLIRIITEIGLTHEAATMVDNDYENTRHHHVLGLLPASRRVAKAGKLRDGDGDGMVLDGKPGQRAATPAEKARGRAARAAKKLSSSKRGGRKPSAKRFMSQGPVGSDPGSVKNPINCKSATEALDLIASGKHVVMDKDMVGVVLEKLAKIGQEAFEAEKAGKKVNTPDYDLCRIHVPDSNLFCVKNKGIPRIKMPQVKGKNIRPGSKAEKLLAAQNKANGTPDNKEVDSTAEFRDYLKSKGIKITNGQKVDASKLKATQNQLVGSKVGGMMGAAEAGKFDPTKDSIFVSTDNYVLDGHHRWAAGVGRGFTKGSTVTMTADVIDLPIQELVDMTNQFLDEFGILPNAATATSKSAPPCIGCDDEVSKKRGRKRGPNPESSMKDIVGSHGHKPHGPSIKKPSTYEHLRAKGMSKAKAAAISNAQWNRDHGKGAKNVKSTRVTKLSPAEMAQRKAAAIASALKRRRNGKKPKVSESPKAKKRRDMDASARTARAITDGRRRMRSGGTYLPGQREIGKRALTPAEIKQRQVAAYKSALARSMRAKEIERRGRKSKRKATRARGQSGRVMIGRDKQANPHRKNARKAFIHAAEHMAAEATGIGMMANMVEEKSLPWAYNTRGVNAPVKRKVRKDGRIEVGAIAPDEALSGEISKIDDDKRLVYGWMYVTHDVNGEIVVDKSGDFVDVIDELDEAVVDFVLHSRTGGADHDRTLDDSPVQASRLVESIVFTPEKVEALGLPVGSIPNGWWAGWKVDDDEVWKGVKTGKYKSFSVHGTGVREPYVEETSKAAPASVQAARYVGRQVRGARAGTLTSAQRNQRVEAARASARARKGTGTKDKNPQTPETKAAERKRKMLTAKPGTKENKAALTTMRTAIDTGEPMEIPTSEVGQMLQAAAEQGFAVSKGGDGIYSIKTKTGVLRVRTKGKKSNKTEGA
jgi:hypothetical protein